MQAITDPRPLLSLYVRRKLVLGSIPNSAQFFWMMVIIIVIYLTKRRIAWESWFLYSSHLKENPSDLRNLPGVFNTSGYWVAHSITMIFEERWTNWNLWGHEKIRAENYNFESLAKALENILDKEGLKGVIKILNPRNKSHLDLPIFTSRYQSSFPTGEWFHQCIGFIQQPINLLWSLGQRWQSLQWRALNRFSVYAGGKPSEAVTMSSAMKKNKRNCIPDMRIFEADETGEIIDF